MELENKEEQDLNQIVLIDENKVVLKLAEKILKKYYEVKSYYSAAQFFEDIDNIDPSLFIFDWNMEGVDGLELTRMIRRNHKFDQVQIAIFTAEKPTKEVTEKVFHAGAQCFIHKKIDTWLFLSQIKTLISYHKSLKLNDHNKNTMVSILKHDIVNALTGVVTGLNILGVEFEKESPEKKQIFEIVKNSVDRLEERIDDLSIIYTADYQKDHESFDYSPLCDSKEILTSILTKDDSLCQKFNIDFDLTLIFKCDFNRIARALYYMSKLYHDVSNGDHSYTLFAKSETERFSRFHIGIHSQTILYEKLLLNIDSANDIVESDASQNVLAVQFCKITAHSHGGSLHWRKDGDSIYYYMTFPLDLLKS